MRQSPFLCDCTSQLRGASIAQLITSSSSTILAREAHALLAQKTWSIQFDRRGSLTRVWLCRTNHPPIAERVTPRLQWQPSGRSLTLASHKPAFFFDSPNWTWLRQISAHSSEVFICELLAAGHARSSGGRWVKSVPKTLSFPFAHPAYPHALTIRRSLLELRPQTTYITFNPFFSIFSRPTRPAHPSHMTRPTPIIDVQISDHP